MKYLLILFILLPSIVFSARLDCAYNNVVPHSEFGIFIRCSLSGYCKFKTNKEEIIYFNLNNCQVIDND